MISQVVLSFGIPFALVPLLMLTRRADIMGSFVNRRVTTVAPALDRRGDHRAQRVPALRTFLALTTESGPAPFPP